LTWYNKGESGQINSLSNALQDIQLGSLAQASHDFACATSSARWPQRYLLERSLAGKFSGQISM